MCEFNKLLPEQYSAKTHIDPSKTGTENNGCGYDLLELSECSGGPSDFSGLLFSLMGASD